MNNVATGGAVPIVNMFDYLRPEINRPDLYQQQAYPLQGGRGGAALSRNKGSLMKNTNSSSETPQSVQRHDAAGNERPPQLSLYYTIGLILLSAAIFLSLAAWSNVLLSWFDSMYVNPVVSTVTKSRLYFAITLTIISILVIIALIAIWYYFTVQLKL